MLSDAKKHEISYAQDICLDSLMKLKLLSVFGRTSQTLAPSVARTTAKFEGSNAAKKMMDSAEILKTARTRLLYDSKLIVATYSVQRLVGIVRILDNYDSIYFDDAQMAGKTVQDVLQEEMPIS